MGRPDDIARRLTGEEDNCDVVLTDVKTGTTVKTAAFIPVFMGAGAPALFDPGVPVHPGDRIHCVADGRRFRVVQVLGKTREGRLSVQLEKD
jgi:hypothetical protein